MEAGIAKNVAHDEYSFVSANTMQGGLYVPAMYVTVILKFLNGLVW